MRSSPAQPGRSPAPRLTSGLADSPRASVWSTVTALLTRRRVTTPALAVAMMAATLPVLATPASAAVLPVAPEHSIEVFPGIDMVGVADFDDPFVVEVWRDGVKVGSSGAPVETGLLELNHDGPPCWAGTTPDIMAGDQIRVVTDGSDPGDPVGEFITVADLDAETPELVALDDDGVVNDIVMKGRALNVEGTGPLPIARMSAEIVQPAFRDAADVNWDRRAIGAQPGGAMPDADTVFDQEDAGVLAYDPTGPGNEDGTRWTATWKNLPGSIGSLALGGEHTIASWSSVNAAGEGNDMTIMDAEDASGPGIGCPAASADAVTDTSPSAVNIAARDAGGDLVISGTSYNAAAVEVTVDDGDATTTDALSVAATVSAPAPLATTDAPVPPVHQTWTARVPMASITAGDLDDGELSISGSYARVVEQRVQTATPPAEPGGEPGTVVTYTHTAAPIGGRDHSIVKDLVAPAPPSVFPAGGIYYGAQNVTATAADPAEETVRYTVHGTDAAEPAAASPVIAAPYGVTGSQQLKLAAYDRAGNRSSTVTETYDMRTAGAPGAPGGLSGVAGNGAVSLSWNAPDDNGGHPITGYRVRAYSPTGGLVRALESAGTSMVFSGLANGTAYTFDVRASNVLGTGPASAASAAIALRERTAPRVTAVSPAANSKAVSQYAKPTVTFSEPVTGVTGGTMRLYRAGSTTPVDATVSYNPATRVATLNPYGAASTVLAVDARYVLALGAGIRDSAGNPLPSASWSFTTGPRPTVAARYPASGATGVRRSKDVTVRFSEAVAGLNGATVRLTRVSTGGSVPGTVSYNSRTRTVTFNPYGGSRGLLRANTKYRVRLSSGITDRAGNPLTATSWTFTTGTS